MAAEGEGGRGAEVCQAVLEEVWEEEVCLGNVRRGRLRGEFGDRTLMANLRLVNVTSRRWVISDSTPRTMPLFRSTERG